MHPVMEPASHCESYRHINPQPTCKSTWFTKTRRFTVSARAVWHHARILRLDKVASLICNIYPSMAAHTFVSSDLSQWYSATLLRRSATTQQHLQLCFSFRPFTGHESTYVTCHIYIRPYVMLSNLWPCIEGDVLWTKFAAADVGVMRSWRSLLSGGK